VKEELKRDGLTLCQDADLAYTSKATLKYANKNRIKLLTLPSVSLDFSITETMAQLLKRAFHKRRYTSKKATLARFRQVFNKIDQGKVQELYK
jgi:hypothetical protein